MSRGGSSTETLGVDWGATERGGRSALAFEALIEVLRRRGFTITVDHHLRLGRLLDELGDRCSPSDLRDLLSPIFASNAAEQEIFHEVFAALYPRLVMKARKPSAEVPEIGESPEPPATGPVERPHRWPFVVATIVSLAMVFALGSMLALRLQTVTPSIVIEPTEPLEEPIEESTEESTEDLGPQADRSDTRPQPLPSEIAASAEGLSRATRVSLRWTITALPLVLLASFLLYRHRHRRLVLRRDTGARAPLVWPLELTGQQPGPFERSDIKEAARLLRRRRRGSALRLDVPATVRATVVAAGRADLRYRRVSHVPEYLALIDRRCFGDHRAAFAAEMLSGLEAEGLFVHRYVFEDDPRLCRDGSGACFSLADLRDRHGDGRLLVCGDGRGLLDPLTGRFAAWVGDLFSWPERALLTPRDPESWDLSERVLASELVVLPCSLASLLALSEHFEADMPRRPPAPEHKANRGYDRGPYRDGPSEEQALNELRSSLGEPTFQWLCACAVHPELQWDWTLHLAGLDSMGPGLLEESRILSLIRLPYFRAGRIPGRLRWLLIRELTQEREREVRAALVEVLENNPPPEKSTASQARELQLQVHHAFQNRKQPRSRLAAARALRSYPRARRQRDEAAFRVLETLGTSPLELILPNRLRGLLYLGGRSAHGLRTWPIVAAALLLSFAFFSMLGPSRWESPEAVHRTEAELAEEVAVPIPPSTVLEESSSEIVSIEEVVPDESSEEVMASESDPESDPQGPEGRVESILVDRSESPDTPAVLPRIVARDEAASREDDLVSEEEPIRGIAIEDEARTEDTAVPIARPQPRPEDQPEVVEQDAEVPVPEEEISEEPPSVVIDDQALSVLVRLDPSKQEQKHEIPIRLYSRPVDFYSVRVEVGKNIFRRNQVFVQARLSNAGGSGYFGILEVELLDTEGLVIATSQIREPLDVGANRLEVSWKLQPEDQERLAAVHLDVDLEHESTTLDRLKTFMGEEPDPVLDPIDRGLISMSPDEAVVLLPRDFESARLDLYHRPIDYHEVRVKRLKRSVEISVTAANPGEQDYRVWLVVSALDADGALLGTKTDKRVLEEGERDKALKVRIRLSPAELARLETLRVAFRSSED